MVSSAAKEADARKGRSAKRDLRMGAGLIRIKGVNEERESRIKAVME
jgi:hypothetical protein